MPRNMMEADMSAYSYTNEYYYGISDVSKIVPESVSLLHSLRTFMAGDVDTITLSADIFNDDQSAVTNAQVISQIGRCKTLRVDGTVGIGTSSRVFLNQGCTILLNKLQISEKINIRDVYPDASINLSKISHIPYTEYCLSSVTPINLLNCASRETKICVPDFSLSDINLFMKEWLQSPTTNIHRLTLKVNNAEEENIEKMFEGLAHLGIKAPCCSFKTHCTNASCAHQKLIHLKITGVDLHRSDGAVATVFYSAAVQHFSFVFFVRYPGECSKTRVKEHTRKLDKVLKKHRKVLEELRWLTDFRNRIIGVFGG
ncbi:Protein CBG27430 [Caenorhabditis briggsae]|uniref:Protein CBG27430 n=1 Tax=Caenorhabditis briggsae TaxID=6238 RepID=B6IK07_CAEBR|nr:Protein CBG27430 [Caenorhabditis briggsae]CAS00237.1 Protein CBG27430 [Caenorhabditis briggsae]